MGFILLFGFLGISGLILFIPIILYVIYEELIKTKVIEYISGDFNYACKAYDKGFEVKKKLIDGVNWTQFNPYIKNPQNYIFKITGISKESLMD